ncbi:type II toxin-antitoxin system RelE/ParE family toxin [Herbidospora mongoliensis]|uniref:type II toxin-antitoxin system RelE/ParE family toxin n=1 Tax=Herbidospora mongoliensis TaxID=688067 RepID=UPI00082BB1CF|nr:type II toxin-antitoxin system RelE/ParE family toxin [Herbidospora mongoliensis]
MTWGNVKLELEVSNWLEGLTTAGFTRAEFYIKLLEDQGPLLSEPYTRQLDGKLRELRFYLHNDQMRITYWIAPGRQIVLLTVFRKTRMREARQVERARRALRLYIEAAQDRDDEEI